jgi:hypothetical protein
MKTQLIRNLILSLGILVSTSTYAQESGELKIPLSNPGERGKLIVDMNSGSITVVGSSVNEVLVKYSVPEKKVKDKDKGGKNEDGLNRIGGSALDLEASEKNNVVEVESDSWNQRVDLEIQVPQNFDLHLKTYNNGDIVARSITGEVEADNYNGKITLENISGTAVADTYNGRILVTFDSVIPDTPMAFTNYNGNIDLTFPANYKASFKMKTKQGEIFEGFDMTIEESKPRTETQRESGEYKVKIDDWIRGSINGGGSEISMQTYNGDLYIRKK